MQFIENILLLQCINKEAATAKEHDLRPLGKVIIFRDRQADRQNLPIIYIDTGQKINWLFSESAIRMDLISNFGSEQYSLNKVCPS